jgi:enoyl-CoA hydratase/carnithine racemase
MRQNDLDERRGEFMAYQTLTFEKKENVVIISIIGPLEVPERMLRLSDELTEICGEITWDEEVRVVVLTGSG